MTDILDQYRTIVSGAGWADRSRRGRIKVSGADARSFLHALVSNDVDGLQPGQGVYATYLTPQGRLVADLNIFHLGDALLLETPPGLAADLAARFDQLVFAEDVSIADISAETGALLCVGQGAAAAVAGVTGGDAAAIAGLLVRSHIHAGDLTIARSDEAALPSFLLFGPFAQIADVVLRLESAGVAALDPSLVEALRIEVGRPLFGVDMTTDTIPLEAGLLERAISMSKGCYVGQEVIVRVMHRGGGRVVKHLVVMQFGIDATMSPQAGAVILDGDREVGRITSAALSPAQSRVIALGYVHRDAATIGQRLVVRSPETPDEIVEIVAFAG